MRITDLLANKNNDHDEHMLKVRKEMEAAHRMNLSQQLNHKADIMNKEFTEHTAELKKRLEVASLWLCCCLS